MAMDGCYLLPTTHYVRLAACQDFVAFHADCKTGEVTFARCECEGGVPPSCSLTVEASEEATRLSSAPPRHSAPARLLSLGLAVLGAWAVRGRLAG